MKIIPIRHELLSNQRWGLCANTTEKQIKSLAPHVAEYAKYWLGIEKL